MERLILLFVIFGIVAEIYSILVDVFDVDVEISKDSLLLMNIVYIALTIVTIFISDNPLYVYVILTLGLFDAFIISNLRQNTFIKVYYKIIPLVSIYLLILIAIQNINFQNIL